MNFFKSSISELPKLVFSLNEFGETPTLDTYSDSFCYSSGLWNKWFGCWSGSLRGFEGLDRSYLCGCTTFILLRGGVDHVLGTRIDFLNSCSGGFDEKYSKPRTSYDCTSSLSGIDESGWVGGTWFYLVNQLMWFPRELAEC